MGLLDHVSRVLTVYKADTTDLKAKIKELQGEEKKLAEERLKGAEAGNKSTDDFLKSMAKVTAVVASVAAVTVTMWDGFKLGAEQARLATAAIGTDLERLTRASLGLKTQTDLLRDAAKFQSGEFKLSQKQMEDMERAMVALNRRFNDGGEASKKLMQAVVELKVDGLLELGIPIDKTGASMDNVADRALLFERAMRKVAEVGRDVKDGQLAAGEGMQQATTKLRDSWDKLKVSIGQLATAFEPLIRSLSTVVDLLAGEGGASALVRQFTNDAKVESWLAGGATLGQLRQSGWRYDGEHWVSIADTTPAAGFASFDPLRTITSLFGPLDWKTSGSAKPGDPFINKLAPWDQVYANTMRLEASQREREARRGSELGSAAIDFGNQSFNDVGYVDPNDLTRLAQESMTQNWQDRIANGRRSRSFLEQVFGRREEFDLYKEMFSGLVGSMSNAYGGLVDGTLSAGQALKQIARDVLKGLGLKMAVRAVEETAEGFAALSNTFTAVSAATHFKAAAVFAGGAVLAGYAASQIGGASSGGGGGGGAAGGGYAAGAPRDGWAWNGSSWTRRPDEGGGPTLIVISHPFGRMTGRQQALEAERLVNDAMSGRGSVTGGSY